MSTRDVGQPKDDTRSFENSDIPDIEILNDVGSPSKSFVFFSIVRNQLVEAGKCSFLIRRGDRSKNSRRRT